VRVLVTGATGFVGRALMRRLAAAGHEAIPVTRGPAEGRGAVRWDLGTEPAPASLPERIDAIVHAAQARNYRAFPGDAAEMFAVNAAATFALLDYAVRAGASRFCLLSTGTVYEPFDRGLGEDAPLAPTSMLGATKLAAEVIARPYAALFPLAVLRIFTPYGPGQTGRLIPNLIDRVRDGVAVQLSADGHGMRLAPIYVDDLCAMIVAGLDARWSGVFNVAAPQATTIHGVAEAVGRILGVAPWFETGAGAALDLAPPVDRLGQLFDLETLLPLEEGLRRTVAALA
jgi:UDP-glucose 4-epimerase